MDGYKLLDFLIFDVSASMGHAYIFEPDNFFNLVKFSNGIIKTVYILCIQRKHYLKLLRHKLRG